MTVEDRAAKIRLVAMDVDGTLTDGSMYFSAEGEALKRFSTRDGMGITLLQRSSIECVIITSENSLIAQRRAEKLRIKHVILHSHNKTDDLRVLLEDLQCPFDAVAYIGDDVNDVPVMQCCGLVACPSDAVTAVKQVSHYVCNAPGGNGAVRELSELILTSQGKPITLSENW